LIGPWFIGRQFNTGKQKEVQAFVLAPLRERRASIACQA
jgi:hypothetical protein